jgi:hypothetical protein
MLYYYVGEYVMYNAIAFAPLPRDNYVVFTTKCHKVTKNVTYAQKVITNRLRLNICKKL